MSSTSRALALAASVAMLSGACTGTAVRGSENPRHETAVVIGAGSVGSDYYPLGGAVCGLVNLGDAGSGHRLAMERVMEALGVTHADLALVTALPPGEQNDALCEGRVDAVVDAAGHPNGIVQERSAAAAAGSWR